MTCIRRRNSLPARLDELDLTARGLDWLRLSDEPRRSPKRIAIERPLEPGGATRRADPQLPRVGRQFAFVFRVNSVPVKEARISSIGIEFSSRIASWNSLRVMSPPSTTSR